MTDLIPVQHTDTWVTVMAPVGDLAQKIAQTEFVPKAMRGKPAAVAAAILTGRELDLGPMASLRGLQVIEGSVSLTAQMTAARILAAGHRIEWVESTDKTATVRITRGDGLGEAAATFTIGDAQRAGLAGKSNWLKWPRAMLRARALSECAGMICADVVLGLDTTGEPAATEPPAGPVEVIQMPPRTYPDTATGRPQPEPEPEPEPDVVEAVIIDQPATITGPQMRLLQKLIGDYEAAERRKLTRTERRDLIAGLAEIEELASAKDLTADQARLAIDKLQDILTAIADIPQAEAPQ